MKKIRGVLLLSTILVSLPATAQTANPLAERENRVPPVVGWLQTQGTKLTYLGEEGGLRGYIAEAANGKMQVFYVTPDGNHVVAGILWKSGGSNITGIQIGEMRARFDAAATLGEASASMGTTKSDTSPVASKMPAEAASEITPGTPAPSVVSPAAETEKKLETGVFGDPAAPTFPATPIPAPAVTEPAATLPATSEPAQSSTVTLPAAIGPVAGASGNPSELWASKIDKAEFLKAAEASPFIEVGSKNAPSTMWMIADPQCPFCHKTWDYLKASVYAKKLKIRVIMIAFLPGSDPIARDMLARPLPARAWLDSNAGQNLKPQADQSSPEFQKAGEFLDMNMAFAKKFGIDRTPFLGYVADDGQFYTALGLPSDLGSFIAAAKIK